MPSLIAQASYWRQHPPVHMLVAAYLDYKPAGATGATPQANNDAAVEALIAMAPPLPDHLKPRIPGHGRQ